MEVETHGWIWVRNLGIDDARVGVHDWEHLQTQSLEIDVGAWTNTASPGRSDSLHDTLDWSKLAACVLETTASRHFKLIESLCEALASRVLGFPHVGRVRIEVRKLGCMANGIPAVSIERLASPAR